MTAVESEVGFLEPRATTAAAKQMEDDCGPSPGEVEFNDPREQQQAVARGKSAAQKAQKKWQSLPQ